MKQARKPSQVQSKIKNQESKITLLGSCGRDWPTKVAQVLHTVSVAEKKPLGLVEIAVLTGHKMSKLHAEWYADPSLTDVISFDLSTAGEIAGQIFVCQEVARQEARKRGHAVQEELLLYVLHGLLHLCGYDDTTPAAYRRMHRREDELLAQMALKVRFFEDKTEQFCRK